MVDLGNRKRQGGKIKMSDCIYATAPSGETYGLYGTKAKNIAMADEITTVRLNSLNVERETWSITAGKDIVYLRPTDEGGVVHIVDDNGLGFIGNVNPLEYEAIANLSKLYDLLPLGEDKVMVSAALKRMMELSKQGLIINAK
jgi:hypothetical protein